MLFVSCADLSIPGQQPLILVQAQVPEIPSKNPLIARHWQQAVYIGSFLLVIILVMTLGLLNRQVEYALMFAFILSIVLIGVLLFL